VKWNPGKVIYEAALDVARKAAAQIRAATPRVAHRAGKTSAGQIGGSLVAYILRPDFIRHDRIKAVLQWHALGAEGRWFCKGTSRQAARPFDTLPDKAQLVARLQADAAAHVKKRMARLA